MLKPILNEQSKHCSTQMKPIQTNQTHKFPQINNQIAKRIYFRTIFVEMLFFNKRKKKNLFIKVFILSIQPKYNLFSLKSFALSKLPAFEFLLFGGM